MNDEARYSDDIGLFILFGFTTLSLAAQRKRYAESRSDPFGTCPASGCRAWRDSKGGISASLLKALKCRYAASRTAGQVQGDETNTPLLVAEYLIFGVKIDIPL